MAPVDRRPLCGAFDRARHRSLQQEELRLRDAVAHYLPPQSRSASPEDV
jgi:hypothetical protein